MGNVGGVDGEQVLLGADGEDLLDEAVAGEGVDLLVEGLADVGVDYVGQLLYDQLLEEFYHALVDLLALLVLEDHVDLELGRVKRQLRNLHAKPYAVWTLGPRKPHPRPHINPLQPHLQLALLPDPINHQMVLKMFSLHSHIDILGMHIERILPSHVQDIRIPVDLGALGDVGHVHLDVDQVDGLVDGDVGRVEVGDELGDYWARG